MRLAEKLLWDVIRDIAETGDEYITSCDEYVEPGYSTDTDGAPILFADWNTYSGEPMANPLRVYVLNSIQSLEDACRIYLKRLDDRNYRNRIARIGELAEKLGWGVEWCDEWYICYCGSGCGKAVRTVGDSYSWTASFFMGDGEIQCIECVLDDPEALEDHLTDNPDSADTMGVDWHARGWHLTRPDYENGWHPGQTDNPRDILERLNLSKVSALFVVNNVGQFDCSFSLWIRPLDSQWGSGVDYDPPARN